MEILRDRGVEFDVIEYLKEPLDRTTLKRIASLLMDPVTDLVRQDQNFKELGLDISDYRTQDAVIDLLIEHPKVMQRPIFVSGDRALVCRPSDKILQLL